MKKNIRIYLFLIFIFILIPLLFFLGLKIWISQQYNKEGNLLIVSYSDPPMLYEITRSKIVVWEYNLSKDIGIGFKRQCIFSRISRLKNGNTLIADRELSAVYEVDRSGKIVWHCKQFTNRDTITSRLNDPEDAQRLPNGNTLIVDTGNRRVIEATKECDIIWEYICPKDVPDMVPVNALQFSADLIGILTLNQWYKYVEVEMSSKRIIWELDMGKYGSPFTEILPNKHLLLGHPNFGVLELDTLNNVVWSFDLESANSRIEEPAAKRKANVFIVYLRSKGNTFVKISGDIAEVTPSKEIIWNLSEDEIIRNILSIKFFLKIGKEEHYGNLYWLVDVVRH